MNDSMPANVQTYTLLGYRFGVGVGLGDMDWGVI